MDSLLGFLGCESLVRLAFYPDLLCLYEYCNWGCAGCLHAVAGEGWALKEILNPLPGPKSRSAVCGYSVVFGLLLCICIRMFNVL